MLNLRSDEVLNWFPNQLSDTHPNYRHRLLLENPIERAGAIIALRRIIEEAHTDAKRYLQRCTQETLDPLASQPTTDVANAYPRLLALTTKKGYFGEIMAGVVAENFASSDTKKWRVPVFLFRLHELAFDQLETWRETGQSPQHMWGQTGDDCLAFSRDVAGRIVAALVCEGKCTNDHDSSMIRDAHLKLNSPLTRPVSLSRIIGILRDQQNDAEALDWAKALLRLYNDNITPDYQRCDLVSYTCGRRPSGSRSTWMRVDLPSPEYTAGRELESVEVHLTGVDALVSELYDT